jgi:division/cell wall cluster transcriptional repressor MraZ
MNGQSFALLIGNGQFHQEQKLPSLGSPAYDVRSLGSIFSDKDIFENIDPRILLDETESKLRREIYRFFADRENDDLLILYISGHGIKDDRGNLYFACADTELGLLEVTALPAAFIRDQMSHSMSKKQVLILDCCYSGAFTSGRKAAPAEEFITKEIFGAGSGRIILTASNSVEFAWESEKSSGTQAASLFTQALIEGLQTGKADSNNDSWITISEWYEYAFRQVKEKTSKQNPRYWAENVEGNFLFARNKFYKRPAEFSSTRFLGSFSARLSKDLRIRIPLTFASELSGDFVVIQGFDECLMLLTMEQFNKIYERISALSQTDPNSRLLRRLILGSALVANMDRSNRILLPQNLLGYARLTNEILFYGCGDHVEIWEKEYMEKKTNLSFDHENIQNLQSLLREILGKL